MDNTPTFLIGDSHGEWDRVFSQIDRFGLRDCILISVGDIGIGFVSHEKQIRQIGLINNRFKKRNIRFAGIRGNHDNPLYFKGPNRIAMSNFELLKDYAYRTINGEKFLFVGGAVSVDRRNRVPTVSWWEDEEFKLIPEKIEQCDVLITHSAPTWIGPSDKAGISNWCINDSTLWGDCCRERKLHDVLLKLAKPKRLYCGHFHEYFSVDFDGTYGRVLDILEIVEHRK